MDPKPLAYVHNAWEPSNLGAEDGFSYLERPMCFFLTVARYKFAARLLRPEDRVLDLASGAGIGTHFLSRFCRHVTGGDVDRQSVENARRTFKGDNLTFEEVDLLDPEFVHKYSKRFDAIVSIDTLEHFHLEQGRCIIRNFFSILPPGGLLVLGTPNVASSEFASPWRRAGHLHEYGPEELRQEIETVFGRCIPFSMTDEVVSTSFPKMAWYLMNLCVRHS